MNRYALLPLALLLLPLHSYGQTPGAGPALLERAQRKSAASDFTGAIEDYTKAITANSNSPLLYSIYLDRGIAKFRINDFAGARADYDKAIELNPSYAPGYVHRAAAIVRSEGNTERAIADYTRAIELNPVDPYPYTLRGDVHMASGNSEAALADYSRAIQNGPDRADFYTKRGGMHYLAENFDAAIADFTRAVTLDPANARAYFMRGTCKTLLDAPDLSGACDDLHLARNFGFDISAEEVDRYCNIDEWER